MTDETTPRVRLDEALEEMRSTLGSSSQPVRLTAEATVACAEALSLLVDAQVAATGAKPKPEPSPDPRESLPDDTPVGHGWVMGWGRKHLFKPESNGSFTRWNGYEWGVREGRRGELEVGVSRPATVGDLRAARVPVAEWPHIAAPEPDRTHSPHPDEVMRDAVAQLRRIAENLAPVSPGYATLVRTVANRLDRATRTPAPPTQGETP